MDKKILVVGGAGYIGSHMVKKLKAAGFIPIIYDNLTTGHSKAVEGEILIEADVRSQEDLNKAFKAHKIQAVMHFCAKSLVGESMEKPDLYFDNNVIGGFQLLEAMRKNSVNYIIFSSTAATFGQPDEIPIKETTIQKPTNPYGESKLIFEKMLKWYDECYGIKSVSLRYFNAAGADDSAQIGEDHSPETHLIPIILQVVNNQRDYLQIFGDDYPTKDGTCVRDYIHIYDLADAHLLALNYMLKENISDQFNLGSGEGYSVKEILLLAEKITGQSIPSEIAPRRAGDPTTLIASSEKIKNTLGWEPKYNLEDIIKTAVKWHRTSPGGYKE